MVKWRVYVSVCFFPKHSWETTVFSRVLFSGWFQLLVNIWGACVPSRSCPLSSSFGIWRDLLDWWHFHPTFLLAPLYLFLLFPIAFPSLHPSPPLFCSTKAWNPWCLSQPDCTAKCPWTCIDPAWGIISFTSVHSQTRHTRHGNQ